MSLHPLSLPPLYSVYRFRHPLVLVLVLVLVRVLVTTTFKSSSFQPLVLVLVEGGLAAVVVGIHMNTANTAATPPISSSSPATTCLLHLLAQNRWNVLLRSLRCKQCTEATQVHPPHTNPCVLDY